MPQLHLYLSKELAAEVRRRAERSGSSVSGYLAAVVRSQVADEWPTDFFDQIAGGWAGEPLERSQQPHPDTRDPFEATASTATSDHED
jgi:hypothetical protein